MGVALFHPVDLVLQVQLALLAVVLFQAVAALKEYQGGFVLQEA
jgi:hypothetical protein